ncbi:hypothetical protein AZE42_08065, partial [Rhizopogon vesiculosus]
MNLSHCLNCKLSREEYHQAHGLVDDIAFPPLRSYMDRQLVIRPRKVDRSTLYP